MTSQHYAQSQLTVQSSQCNNSSYCIPPSLGTSGHDSNLVEHVCNQGTFSGKLRGNGSQLRRMIRCFRWRWLIETSWYQWLIRWSRQRPCIVGTLQTADMGLQNQSPRQVWIHPLPQIPVQGWKCLVVCPRSRQRQGRKHHFPLWGQGLGTEVHTHILPSDIPWSRLFYNYSLYPWWSTVEVFSYHKLVSTDANRLCFQHQVSTGSTTYADSGPSATHLIECPQLCVAVSKCQVINVLLFFIESSDKLCSLVLVNSSKSDETTWGPLSDTICSGIPCKASSDGFCSGCFCHFPSSLRSTQSGHQLTHTSSSKLRCQ